MLNNESTTAKIWLTTAPIVTAMVPLLSAMGDEQESLSLHLMMEKKQDAILCCILQ